MNNSPTQQMEDMDLVLPRSRWKFGLMGWVLLVGLILIVGGMIFESLEWNKQTIGWILYRIDPRYWSLLPVPVLWTIVALIINGTLKERLNIIQQNQRRVVTGILFAGFCWFFWIQGRMFRRLYNKIYFGIYVNYIMGPMVQYIVDGKWNWKLLITPTLGVVVIASLLYIAYQQRKKK